MISVNTTDMLSGDLYTYFAMTELSGGTSKSLYIMNFEVPPESSVIAKYVYRPPDSTSIALTNVTTTCDTTQSIDLNCKWAKHFPK